MAPTASSSSGLNGPVARFIGSRARSKVPASDSLTWSTDASAEGTGSGSTGHTRSPATPSASRLVATTRTPELDATRPAIELGDPR